MEVSTKQHLILRSQLMNSPNLEAHVERRQARHQDTVLSIRLAGPHHRCNVARDDHAIRLDASQRPSQKIRW